MMPVYLNSVIDRRVCEKVCMQRVSEGMLYFQSPGSHCACTTAFVGRQTSGSFSKKVTFEKQGSSSFMSSVLVPHISVMESRHGHSTLTSLLASSGLLRPQF